MKLDQLTTAELKTIGFDWFVRRAQAQQQVEEATQAINQLLALISEREAAQPERPQTILPGPQQ
jgi:hypothetical protein